MTDLFFRSLEDLKNRIQIQSSLGGELFLCKRMEICYNKKRDDTKREVLNMAKDERNAYTIQNDASLGEVKIADEVVAIIAALAATEVDGVASMAGNITNEVIGKLGIKNLSCSYPLVSYCRAILKKDVLRHPLVSMSGADRLVTYCNTKADQFCFSISTPATLILTSATSSPVIFSTAFFTFS